MIDATSTPQELQTVDREPRPAPLTGRWTQLVPLSNTSMRYLYTLAVERPLAFAWRFGPGTPNPAAFEAALRSVLSLFVVHERRGRRPVGVVMAHHANVAQGFAYISGGIARDLDRTGLGVEPLRLFVNYLFTTFPFRKLYLELPESEALSLASGIGHGGLFRLEGRLTAHTYYAGRYQDLVILAIYREARQCLSATSRTTTSQSSIPEPEWGARGRFADKPKGRLRTQGN